MQLTRPELVEAFRALRIKQKWWSSNHHYVIEDAVGRIVGDIRGSSWSWRPWFVTAEGVLHIVNCGWRGTALWDDGVIALECDGVVAAEARASGGWLLFPRHYSIQHAGNQYKLEHAIKRGCWIVYEHSCEIGSLVDESSDTTILTFHKEASILLRLFAFYLTVSYSLED